MNVAAALLVGRARLTAAKRGGLTEAERLMESVMRKRLGYPVTRSELYARSRDPISLESVREFERMVGEVVAGRPLQHVTRTQFFFEHEYEVGPEALIPRPETEVLIATAIQELREPKLGLEIGIGSGILSIELLAKFSGLRMVATELSPSAVQLARKNADRIVGPGRLEIRSASALEDVLGALIDLRGADFLISNPPYLRRGEATDEVSSHEPAQALWAPEQDPLHFYREIALGARDLLAPGAPVFLELPHERAEEIRDLFATKGFGVRIVQDLTARPRVLVATLA